MTTFTLPAAGEESSEFVEVGSTSVPEPTATADVAEEEKTTSTGSAVEGSTLSPEPTDTADGDDEEERQVLWLRRLTLAGTSASTRSRRFRIVKKRLPKDKILPA